MGGQIHLNVVTVIISIKFDWHKIDFVARKYFTGSMPLLAPNHCSLVTRLSPQPQFLGNVAERPVVEGRDATSWKPIRRSLTRVLKIVAEIISMQSVLQAYEFHY